MKIVFATFGSLGDIHPVLALALEMKARGHDVVFATSEYYREKIETAGLRFAPLRPEISPDDKQLVADLMDIKSGTERLLRGLLFPALRDSYDDLATATRDADLLVASETIYAAPIVAAKTRLRWVSLTLAPMSFFSAHDTPVFPTAPLLAKLRVCGPLANRLVLKAARFYTRNWAEPAFALRRELKLPPGRDPIFDEKYSPYRVLALFSHALGAPQPDWPSQTRQIGFCFYDAHQMNNESSGEWKQELEKFLQNGEPPIVFTLGSAAVWSAGRFYDESVRAAKMLGKRALFLAGENVIQETLPASMLALDYAPYSSVFPRACAVVHQGGVGTTAQAMRAGVPQLVMPFSHDQPDNAARVVRNGIGLSLARRNYSAQRAAQKLHALLHNEKTTRNAQSVAQQIAREDGVNSACNEIEKLLLTSL